MQLKNKTIIYFDGHCGLCNRFVDFLIKFDVEEKLYFSPLQKKYPHNVEFDTVILEYNENTYRESEAAIIVMTLLPWPWKAFRVLLFVPRPLRDLLYKIISKSRFKFFKRSTTCKVPTKSQRARFL